MLGPQITPRPGPEVAPRLIAANGIIQLSAIELEQAIVRELDENPALELVERPNCPLCGGPLQFGACPRCLGSAAAAAHDPVSPGGSAAPLADSASASEDEQDPLWSVAAPSTLPERLLAQLRLLLDTSEHEIALYVVGNLNEHGYFDATIEELAETLHVEANRVQFVLTELQKLEPAGIGARNITECLLIQVQHLIDQGIAPPPATRAMIEHHLEDLGQQHFERIRRALNITREEVEETFLFIRANLHPHPAHHYYVQISDPPPASAPVVPSVLIHRSTSVDGYEVEVVESQRFMLRVNPLYRQLRQQPQLAATPGEREHVAHYLERARLFMSHLQRRYLLLRKVAVFLVNYQRDFLDHGPLHLRPLTQAAVAQEIGVHVSTISRATNGKYAQLPSREVIPLNRFFAAEQRVQELIRQLIAHETMPCSDEQLARLLHEQHGITLSRQMVANYRAELGIPAARQRAALQRQRKPR